MSSSTMLLPVYASAADAGRVRAAQRGQGEALAHGEVDLARRGLTTTLWPESVVKINNNIRNQFEVPVLKSST